MTLDQQQQTPPPSSSSPTPPVINTNEANEAFLYSDTRHLLTANPSHSFKTPTTTMTNQELTAASSSSAPSNSYPFAVSTPPTHSFLQQQHSTTKWDPTPPYPPPFSSAADPTPLSPTTGVIKPRNKILQQLFRTKSIASYLVDANNHNDGLKKTLNALDLTGIGIGAIIGTGIFVLTGHVAAINTGPAVTISFLIAGLAAFFAALCYSEMAAMIPVAGSAYSYAYATMGELVAWIIGFDLMLEYLAGSATVAVGWSGYFVSFLSSAFHVQIPFEWQTAPVEFLNDRFISTGAYLNLPAVGVSFFLTAIMLLGIKTTASFNAAIVIIKLLVIVTFIIAAAPHVNPDNFVPYVPANTGSFGSYGASGILQGASIVFFAYIGFDAVSTTAQECSRPQRDLPIGILASLGICTVLYIAVSTVLVGVVPYASLNVPQPIAVGIQSVGSLWLTVPVELGAICGLTSVMLVLLIGQTRIWMGMSHDGLLPPVFGSVNKFTGSPVVTTLLCGTLCAILSGLLPLDVLGELTSIGTLLAFVLVSIGVMILRIKNPDAHRPFRVPFGPYVVPLLGAGLSLLLICTSSSATLVRLLIWMAVGFVFYGVYGFHASKLASRHRKQAEYASADHPAVDGAGAGAGAGAGVPVDSYPMQTLGPVTPIDVKTPQSWDV